MPAIIEFFFDIGSPYTYLASTQMAALAARTGVPVRWRPFLIGGVFKAIGNTAPANVVAKGAHMLVDLKRWAAHYGIPFQFSPLFPVNSLLPMRALTTYADEELPEAAHRVFRAYWVESRDPSDRAVLTDVLGEQALRDAEDPVVKARLRANTDEAVARGAFGAPTFFVGDEMFFGNDRLQFVEAAAKATR